MNESEFNQCVDEIMIAIEEAIDDCGADIDYEVSGGVMTLTVEDNGSKVILSRQLATAQIWVAAKSGGYHFVSEPESDTPARWVCTTTGESLTDLLNRVLEEQLGEAVSLDLSGV
ncbi:MAG: iron donor protein CyaY [bacterium]